MRFRVSSFFEVPASMLPLQDKKAAIRSLITYGAVVVLLLSICTAEELLSTNPYLWHGWIQLSLETLLKCSSIEIVACCPRKP